MADSKENLYLFEAIELRAEYDERIKLIQNLLAGQKSESSFGVRDKDEKEPVDEFNMPEFQERLKKLQTKRVKLNQAIQKANFEYEITFGTEKITLSEALEIRKNLLAEKNKVAEQVKEAAYKRIIHKEERDVVRTARYSFPESYEEYNDVFNKIRSLVNKIHVKNHESVVSFREE